MNCFVFFLLVFFKTSYAIADARLIIHLTDYLANDYSGAVAENGNILSEGEYAEQLEFSQTALKEGSNDPKINQNKVLLEKLIELNSAIEKKSPPSQVVPLARLIQKNVIQVSGLALSPSAWPDYDKAKKLFQNQCASCHGLEGRGDGPDGKDLDPIPANFHDSSRAPLISPFAAFNTIRLGVPGTGMRSFSELSDEDIWALAFYVNTFRFGEPIKSRQRISSEMTNEELLDKAAVLNDVDLETYLQLKDNQPDLLRKVRLYFHDSASSDYLIKAKNLLNLSLKKAQAGDKDDAEKFSLEAYFTGIEPVETKISANDPSAVTRLEQKMASYRKSLKDDGRLEIEKNYHALVEEISKIDELLKGHTMTSSFAFLSGFSIILREGFEAVLVILAILGVGKAAGSSIVTGVIHLGWIISLLLGIVGWFVAGWLISMSGVGRELMEAIASFLAVFILIYVGFWMHRQTEIKRWKEFINVKVKNLTHTKNLVGLFILSFIVTFREVFETVLFLRTIYLDVTDDLRIFIFSGVFVAFAIVLVVSFLITKYRNNIPLQKFFNLSSLLMMILATVLTGKGIHALQEAGIIGITSFPLRVRINLLGVFPSWETIVTQVAVFVAAFIIWKSASRKVIKS